MCYDEVALHFTQTHLICNASGAIVANPELKVISDSTRRQIHVCRGVRRRLKFGAGQGPTRARSLALGRHACAGSDDALLQSTVFRKDAAMGQFGHACMASAATSRNSFSV